MTLSKFLFSAFTIIMIVLPSLAITQTNGKSDAWQDQFLVGTLAELTDLSARLDPMDDLRIFGEPLLSYAARTFDADRLAVLIKHHGSLDAADDAGTTAVMHALIAGRTDNAKLLRKAGASLKGVNEEGLTVRYLAERAGLKNFGPEIPSSLTLPQLDADVANQLFLLAAEAGDTGILELALTQGAAVDTQAENGLQAAHLAALGGHDAAFDWIVSHDLAPAAWRIITSDSHDMTVFDFIIAGEGGGDHARAETMLARALNVPSLAEQFGSRKDDYRTAMLNVGYAAATVRKFAGFETLEAWDIGIPAYSTDSGNPAIGESGGVTRQEWIDVQRYLNSQGVYDGALDGVAGRGTFDGIIKLAVQSLPDLVDSGAGLLQRIRAGDPSVRWRQRLPDLPASTYWQVEQVFDPARSKFAGGYTVGLPSQATRTDRIEPRYLRYGYSDPTDRHFQGIQFQYFDPQDTTAPDYIATLSIGVFGPLLDVWIYKDNYVYRWNSSNRFYTSTAPLKWPAALGFE